MQSRINGSTLPVLELLLQPGETIVSESGQLSWMTPNVAMHTHTQAFGGGGFFGAIKRVVGGGSLFMTEYTAQAGVGEVAFATKLPGHIVPLEISHGQEYFLHRHGFLAGTPQIQLTVGFQQSLGAGIFGGDGFVLQKVGGVGTAWLELSGELVVRDLAPGQTLLVHPGHVGAFQASVNFSITTVRGIRNIFFGGDGLFLAQLTGPGRIWLQTLPLANLAHALAPYLPSGEGSTVREAGTAAVIGGVLGSMFDNRG